MDQCKGTTIQSIWGTTRYCGMGIVPDAMSQAKVPRSLATSITSHYNLFIFGCVRGFNSVAIQFDD